MSNIKNASVLKKKLSDLEDSYQFKLFDASCNNDLSTVKVCSEVLRVLDEIKNICINRGRY